MWEYSLPLLLVSSKPQVSTNSPIFPLYLPPGGRPVDWKSCNFPKPQRKVMVWFSHNCSSNSTISPHYPLGLGGGGNNRLVNYEQIPNPWLETFFGENFYTGAYLFMHASSLVIYTYPLFLQQWLLLCDMHTYKSTSVQTECIIHFGKKLFFIRLSLSLFLALSLFLSFPFSYPVFSHTRTQTLSYLSDFFFFSLTWYSNCHPTHSLWLLKPITYLLS